MRKPVGTRVPGGHQRGCASRPHPGRRPGGDQKGSRVGTRKVAGWAPEGKCISSPPGKAAGWAPERQPGGHQRGCASRPHPGRRPGGNQKGSRVGTRKAAGREPERRPGGNQKGGRVGTRKAAGWAPEGKCISPPPGKAAGWAPARRSRREWRYQTSSRQIWHRVCVISCVKPGRFFSAIVNKVFKHIQRRAGGSWRRRSRNSIVTGVIILREES